MLGTKTLKAWDGLLTENHKKLVLQTVMSKLAHLKSDEDHWEKITFVSRVFV